MEQIIYFNNDANFKTLSSLIDSNENYHNNPAKVRSFIKTRLKDVNVNNYISNIRSHFIIRCFLCRKFTTRLLSV